MPRFICDVCVGVCMVGVFVWVHVLIVLRLHVIVIPWARVVCLIYTPDARGCIYQASHECPWYD